MFKEAYQKKAKPKLMGGLYNYLAPVMARKNGELGIEVEVEATNRLPPRDAIPSVKTKGRFYWVTHNEGSLRNGREYVTSGPIFPEDVEPMVNALYQGFAEYGTTLSVSNRCSTHVHKNVTGKKINHLTSFFVVWNVFEEALIEYCGIARKSNHFCLSSKDSEYVVEAWLRGVLEGNFDMNEGMKYTALNTRPLFEQGSFEIRCGAAYTTPEPVIEWIRIVNAVADFGLSMEDPRDIVYEISGGGAAQLFRRIVSGIPGVYEKVVKDIQTFESSCMAGLRRVQPLIYEIRWEDYLPEMAGEYVPSPFERPELYQDAPPLPDLAPLRRARDDEDFDDEARDDDEDGLEDNHDEDVDYERMLRDLQEVAAPAPVIQNRVIRRQEGLRLGTPVDPQVQAGRIAWDIPGPLVIGGENA